VPVEAVIKLRRQLGEWPVIQFISNGVGQAIRLRSRLNTTSSPSSRRKGEYRDDHRRGAADSRTERKSLAQGAQGQPPAAPTSYRIIGFCRRAGSSCFARLALGYVDRRHGAPFRLVLLPSQLKSDETACRPN